MTGRASGDWRPAATLEVLRLRARMLASIRDFFSARDVLEVETPMLSPAAVTDPALASFATRYTGPLYPYGAALYLHTSPEFPMKRLLAAGSGSIYQVCKVFRDGESGRRHNPEFTMLEWYRVGFDHHALMDEVAELVTALLAPYRALGPAERLTYAEAFERHCGLDPHRASDKDFAACAARLGIHAPDDLMQNGLAGWRDLLLSHHVEQQLGRGRLTFLHDYPATQAALARVRPGNPPLAERFELYLEGIELANGFHELGDAPEQETRFRHDLARRKALELPAVPPDNRLIAALRHGLPACAGVALGFDRLVMLAAGADAIHDALAFPLERA